MLLTRDGRWIFCGDGRRVGADRFEGSSLRLLLEGPRFVCGGERRGEMDRFDGISILLIREEYPALGCCEQDRYEHQHKEEENPRQARGFP